MFKLDYDYKSNKEYITYNGKRIAEVLDEHICKDIVEDFNYVYNRERDFISKHKLSDLKNIVEMMDIESILEDAFDNLIYDIKNRVSTAIEEEINDVFDKMK